MIEEKRSTTATNNESATSLADARGPSLGTFGADVLEGMCQYMLWSAIFDAIGQVAGALLEAGSSS